MKDNFSQQSAQYAQFRPVYPPALYDFILSLTPGRHRAWDCATGNGQVAAVLADHFGEVRATDISAQQLEHAIRKPNIRYAVGAAESTDFPDQYFDLITVAQAAHWFDFERFYAEVRRVLAPGGLLVLWGYGLLRTENPAVDTQLDRFYSEVVGPYWDAERRHVDEAYRSMPFPFAEIGAPEFRMPYRWTRAHFLGYLGTWSAVQHYRKARGEDPVALFTPEIAAVWPEDKELDIWFPVFVRLGRRRHVSQVQPG